MRLNVPNAILSGLTLIAAAIYFGPGSNSVSAHQNQQKWISANVPLMKKWVEEINDHEDRITQLEFQLRRLQ